MTEMVNGRRTMRWQLRWRQSGGKRNRFERKERSDYKKVGLRKTFGWSSDPSSCEVGRKQDARVGEG